MFEHGMICPQANLEKLNPGINFDGLPFSIPTKAIEWKPHGETRIAGVSSFGMGGTNVHAVCEEYKAKETSYTLPSAVITLSANSLSSLSKMQEQLANRLEDSEVSLGDVSFTLTCGR